MKNDFDPLAIGDTFARINDAWQQKREDFSQCCQALNKAMQSAHQKVYSRAQTSLPKEPANGEEILMHWVEHLAWSSRQYHHALCQWLTEYVDNAPELTAESRQKANFWVRQIRAMLDPSNFFWTNPKAVQRFVNSKGKSLNQGLRQWIEDMHSHKGLVSLCDQNSFQLGQNLAATPGQVIFRNELMELIQYAPQTEKVRRIPIVLVQPWINKYYIFDLSPRNSFVSYLVRQGFSVFITSWKNPGSEMRHISFEDYMLRGALEAVNIASDVCQSHQVHLAGYCIGGTLIAALMGWLAHEQCASSVADVTLFSTLLDFSDPGDLGAMIHAKAIDSIEKLAAENGLLDHHHIAAAFRLLNPDDLIWRYVVNNYFYGEPPPRSDMLYWNSDSTNLPEAMCNFYLKSFYLDNLMVRPNALTVGNRSINLKKVECPFYVVGAAKDHICPWKSTFQTCRLIGGKVRYILSDEGHITGIVNPPSPWSKKKYWPGAATRLRNPDKWLAKRSRKKGSWWPDWIHWLAPRSGKMVPPPPMGSKTYPPITPAPGTYVLE
ncbi:MAG: alpha/beta fold hydrolase [Desulfobacteraceae bacterium]